MIADLRLFCFCNAEDSLAIIIMTWTGPYFLFFCRGFKLVGPMVIMVYRMLAQDIVRLSLGGTFLTEIKPRSLPQIWLGFLHLCDGILAGIFCFIPKF